MLTNTTGLTQRTTLGFRKDTLTRLAVPCPHLKKGKCKAFNKENTLRHSISNEKEEELRKKAIQMYQLQMDLVADAADDASLQQLLLTSSGSAFSTNPRDKSNIVARFVEELKQEPAYRQWNLEAELEERLVKEGMRRCPFSHRLETQTALKRARHTSSMEEAELLRRQKIEDADKESSVVVTATVGKVDKTDKALASWQAERRKQFLSLTPMQRSVACLIRQGSFLIPQHVVCDVRKELEDIVEREMADATEDEVEEYLNSAKFESRVKSEEKREVSRTVCRPEFGIFDLSSLPQVVSFMSHHPRLQTVLPETLDYFMSGEDDKSLARGIISGRLTEKELDLSHAARAEELVEAVEWMLYVFSQERRFGARTAQDDVKKKKANNSTSSNSGSGSSGNNEAEAHTRLIFRAGRVVVRSLTMQRCNLVNADGLIASLHKRKMENHLLALDLSNNRLSSLRFLFTLRAHFSERLLRLSLKNNIITRKPEYQEQVRRSLPRLTSLDGEAIRRPPLAFPKPWPLSTTRMAAKTMEEGAVAASDDADKQPKRLRGGIFNDEDPHLTELEHDLVMDTVARHFYIWENRRVPLTELEKKAYAAAEEDLPTEEELNDDNFAHRYLHPSSVFSFTAVPGLTLFDAETMKLNREVELEEDFMGMRLSAHDLKDARVFDVSMKNSSRNLLAGRPALQRFGRGSDNCFLAYQCSIYPERVEVCHHLPGALVYIQKMIDPFAPKGTSRGKKAKAAASAVNTSKLAFGGAESDRRSTLYVVHIHGIMTWRLPSMRAGQCVMAAYDRTMIFTEKLIAAHNYTWERRRSPKLVLSNDQLHLRPAVEGDVPYYVSGTTPRLARLLVQFGLEACKDGTLLVLSVMERTTSDAAEEAALEALVFGPITEEEEKEKDRLSKANSSSGVTTDVDHSLTPQVRAANAALRQVVARYSRGQEEETAAPHNRVLHIYSLLDRPTPLTSVSSLLEAGDKSCTAEGKKTTPGWGSNLHPVSLAMLREVAMLMNEHYTSDAFRAAS